MEEITASKRQTRFKNKSQLLRELSKGQDLYIQNHLRPEASRITKVFNVNSTFFTTDFNGKESWIMSGAECKNYTLQFYPEMEKMEVRIKTDDRLFLSIFFYAELIANK